MHGPPGACEPLRHIQQALLERHIFIVARMRHQVIGSDKNGSLDLAREA